MHPYLQNTLYINLDKRIDRNYHTIDQLKSIGVTFPIRVSATISDLGGAVGCTISHIRCLEHAIMRNWDTVFICEDDITFIDQNVLLQSLNGFSESMADNWDVLLVGGNNLPPFEPVNDFCIRAYNCNTTVGYIVNKHYMPVLLQNFKDGLEKFVKSPLDKQRFAIDVYWKNAQHSGLWYFLLPCTVTQYANYSDIEHRHVDYSRLMLDVDKKDLLGGRLSLSLLQPSSNLSLSLSPLPPPPPQQQQQGKVVFPMYVKR